MKISSIIKNCMGEDLGIVEYCEKQAVHKVALKNINYYFCESCLNKFKHINRKTNIAEFFPGLTSSLIMNNSVTGIRSFSGFGKEVSKKRNKKKEKDKEYYRDLLIILLELAKPKIEYLNGKEIQRVELVDGTFVCFMQGKPIYLQNKDYQNIGYL